MKLKLINQLFSPKTTYYFLGALLPWFIAITIIILLYGLIDGLFLVPPDYQQGDGFRIIYIHVPAAFLSLMIYSLMTVAALIYLIWRIKIADIAIMSAAPLGASFTFIALITGALWGKPMWGTWWVWDARLTSELILLFIYIAVIALHYALMGKREQAVIRNIFVVIGAINLPIIHYSVAWWNTLHQGATISLFGKSHIAQVMLTPLLAMIIANAGIFAITWFINMRNALLWENRKTQWVQKDLTENSNKEG